jgi:hypothetical protein
MSPLLTARPSVTITLRLLGACVATALIAVVVALAGGGTASSAAVRAHSPSGWSAPRSWRT